jgi:hypothetical protein
MRSISRALIPIAFASAAACATAQPKPLPIIDAHTHTHFTGAPEPTSHIPDTLDEYLAEMKDAGVVGAIAHTAQGLEGYVDLQQHGVIHCAGLSADWDAALVEAGLKDGRFRCIKIYLGYVHRWASDPIYEPAYRLAERYAVPVVFHTGDTYSTKGKLKYADPLTIDEVAVDHPDVKFVIAHCGNPWIESAAEVAYKNPNVWLDGSALLIGDLRGQQAKVDEYMVKPLRWVFGYLEDPSKLMFGTDWPLVRMKDAVAAFQRAIPEEHWRKVFYENAQKVFALPPPR